MNKIKLGIIGAGRLGGFHADKAAACPDVELVGVYDPYQPNRDRVAAKHSVTPFESLDELLDRADAVVIAATSSQHAELALAALRRGRHLLVEKPLATNAVDAGKMADLAAQQKIVFQAGHVEQYNPAWTSALTQLESVRNGAPCYIRAERESIYTFRCVDIGAVLDLMIHDLELILSLIPSPVTEICANGFAYLGGHEDSAFAQLKFANGATASLTASRAEAGAKRMMTIYSGEGKLEIDFHTRTTTRWYSDAAVRSGDFAPAKVKPDAIAQLAPVFMTEHFRTEVLTGEPVDALSLEMANFVGAILSGEPSRVPAARAARAVKLAQDILDAMRKVDA